MTELLKIGQLAKKSAVTIDTIRFYEEKGLLRPTSRSVSGYRYYHIKTVNILNFIQSAKRLGFTLAEINNLLKIKISQKGKCSLAQEKIEDKVLEIDNKIMDLKLIKKALLAVSSKCDNSNSKNTCHFLDLLGDYKNEK